MELSVTLLGTGGPRPDAARMASTTLINCGGRKLLFDAGRGVATRLVQAGTRPQELDAIFISHFHFDHIGNLADLLLSIWNSGRTKILPIHGPTGLKTIIDAMFNIVYRADIEFRKTEEKITGDELFDIHDLFEIIEVAPGEIFQKDKITISCQPVCHGHSLGGGEYMNQTDWPCLGFRVETAKKTIAISGDTVDCRGLEIIAQGADLLVLCCYLAKVEQTDFERDIVSKHILVSSDEAGKIAKNYGVRKLVLTHIREKSDAMLEAMEADIRKDFEGDVVMGRDLLVIGA